MVKNGFVGMSYQFLKVFYQSLVVQIRDRSWFLLQINVQSYFLDWHGAKTFKIARFFGHYNIGNRAHFPKHRNLAQCTI